MGKKKKISKKAEKELKKVALRHLVSDKVKSKCCKKYKKSEAKRCGKCPCFDLMMKVA